MTGGEAPRMLRASLWALILASALVCEGGTHLYGHEFLKTGQGGLTVEAYTLNGIFLGGQNKTCTSDICNLALASNPIGRFPGVLSLNIGSSALSIGGKAQYTPNTQDLPFSIGGNMGASAGATQTVYTTAPPGTKFAVILNGSISARNDGSAYASANASISTNRGGGFSGGQKEYVVAAGPSGIVAQGVQYYFLDGLSMNGVASVSGTHGYFHESEFTANVSARFLTEAESTRIVTVSGGGSGVRGESLRNPLAVRVENLISGPMEGVAVDFTPLGCPEGTLPTPTVYTDGRGRGRANVVLGKVAGSCRIRAFCSICTLTNEVEFPVVITEPPEIPVDGGAPNDPLSGRKGGPGRSQSRRGNKLNIGYKLRSDSRLSLVTLAETRAIGVLAGHSIFFEANGLEENLSWQTPAGQFSGKSISVSFAPPAAEHLIRLTSGVRTATARVLVETLDLNGPGERRAQATIAAKYCIDDSDICEDLFALHQEATAFARSTFKSRPGSYDCWNDRCDALKHTYWHALIFLQFRDFAEEFSRELGDAHERDGGPDNEIVMDLRNNELGRSIGRTTVNVTAAQFAVRSAIENGSAWVLQNPTNGWAVRYRMDPSEREEPYLAPTPEHGLSMLQPSNQL